MTGFEIAALVTAIAGAGMQYKAAQDAQARQNREIQASLQNQRKLQMEAEQKALSKAREFAPEDRAKNQQQIAEQITEELIAPVSESQAIRSQQQATQGTVSQDYTMAKAAADLEAMKRAETVARLLGKTTSASRLRMNEGIGLMDTGQAIDQLNSFSRGQQGADNLAIEVAGRVNPGMQLAGSLLQTAGTAGLMAGPTSSIGKSFNNWLKPSAPGAFYP